MSRWKWPRLSRGGQTVRNLALALAALYALWAWASWPLPTVKAAFRRAERQNLTGPGEIQGVFRNSESGLTYVAAAENGQLALYCYSPSESSLSFWPRNPDSPTLMPVQGRDPLSSRQEFLVFAADVPDGTASASLELHISGWLTETAGGHAVYAQPGNAGRTVRPWSQSYASQGQPLKDGGVIFPIRTAGGTDLETQLLNQIFMRRPCSFDYRMEAVFYDAALSKLGTASLKGGAPGGQS